jgi:hypothetical protein
LQKQKGGDDPFFHSIHPFLLIRFSRRFGRLHPLKREKSEKWLTPLKIVRTDQYRER